MIPKEDIKVVIYDADDTLYRVKNTVGFHYHSYFSTYGIKSTIEEIDAVLPVIWKEFEYDYLDQQNEYKTTPKREEKLWKELTYLTLKAFTDKKEILNSTQILDDIYLHFAKAQSRDLIPEALETLKQIKNKGYITAILTNNDKRTHTLVKELGIHKHVEKVITCCELGHKKPSKECFDKTAELFSQESEQMLYIGNDINHDYKAAENAN